MPVSTQIFRATESMSGIMSGIKINFHLYLTTIPESPRRQPLHPEESNEKKSIKETIYLISNLLCMVYVCGHAYVPWHVHRSQRIEVSSLLPPYGS